MAHPPDLLPPFTDAGVLPPGDYPLTLAQLRASVLVSGTPELIAEETWDAPWRGQPVDKLAVLVQQLWQVSLTEIFADGSFVEQKAHPHDIDGYFECDLLHFASGRLQQELNQLEGEDIWN